MTTYWLLNIAFLCVVALVALATWLSRRTPSWRLVGLTAIPLVILTAVFDNVLVGLHIVSYDSDLISGTFVGVAPLEDFSYAIAAVVLLPCLWALLAPRRPSSAGSATEGDPQNDRAPSHTPRSRPPVRSRSSRKPRKPAP